jgi:hypothetical protein
VFGCPDVDSTAVAVEEADSAEHDLDRLAEPQRDDRR